MLRNILGAVVGYVSMVVVVMIGIGLAWLVVGGGSGAFDGESPRPSTIWIAFNIVFGFVAALVGGSIARRIGRSMTAVKILVAVLLVLGAFFAITAESTYAKREPVDKTVAEMSFTEAGQHARNPTWYLFSIPLVGVAGALVGARAWVPDGVD